MNIRALCADIDGTLLDSRRALSNRTLTTIRQIAKRYPFILASSRMPAAMTHLQSELNIPDHPLVCYNGGYVIHQTKGEKNVLESITISLDICQGIVALAEGSSIHISLYHADEWYAPKMDEWTEREERITKVKSTIRGAHEVFHQWQKENKGAHKVMCMGPADEISALEKQLHSKYDSDIHIYCSRSTYLELAPKQISKATGVALVMEKIFNLPMSSVMAFGDNYNDIDMLKAAGVGVAVENARQEVKAIADHITAKSIDDGVALAIEKFLRL